MSVYREEDSRTPPTSRPQGRAAGHEAHTAKASEVQQAVRVPQSSRGLASVAPPGLSQYALAHIQCPAADCFVHKQDKEEEGSLIVRVALKSQL